MKKKSWIFEKYSISYGMEFEFFSYKRGELYDPTIYYLPPKWLHAREYYFGMQEIMSRPYKLSLSSLRRTCRTALETMRRISEDNESTLLLYSHLISKSYGIVSNGVHVHLHITKEEGNALTNWTYLPTSVQIRTFNIIEKIFECSVRKLISHHIHGALCSSSYSFKSRSKFVPVFISPRKDRKPKTLEIRIFDLEDILTPKKLYRAIIEIAEMVLEYLETGNEPSSSGYYTGRIREIEDLAENYYNGYDIYQTEFLEHVAECYMNQNIGKIFKEGELKETYRKENNILEYYLDRR